MVSDPERRLPVNALLAIAAALIANPGLILIDRTSRPCGDGLCAFGGSLILIIVLLLATLVFILRGLKKQEAPRWLFALPPLLWAGLFYLVAV